MRKIPGLQAGRAVAAVLVVITHSIAHQLPLQDDLTHLIGRFGVTLFFAISGFIMVLTTGNDTFSPMRFLYKRLLRIVPMYYIASLVLLLGIMIAPASFKRTAVDWEYIVQSLLFIPAFSPNGHSEIVPFFKLGWTLNYEMFFYVVFSMLFFLNAYRRVVAISGIFLTLISAGIAIKFEAAWALFYTQLDLLPFVAGAWLAILYRNFNSDTRDWLRKYLTVGFGVMAPAIIAYYPNHRHTFQGLPMAIAIVTASIALLSILVFSNSGENSGKFKTFGLIGDASYSIYLFHMFAVGATVSMCRQILGMNLLMTAIFATFGGILVGIGVYILLEKKITGASKTLRIKYSSVAVARRQDQMFDPKL